MFEPKKMQMEKLNILLPEQAMSQRKNMTE